MSLFDDFLESTNPKDTVESRPQINTKRDTGYVTTLNTQDDPLFCLQYVQFQLPANLVSMMVENNILAAVLDNFRILRIDLDHPLDVDVVDISRKNTSSQVSQLFLDPTGRHIIVTTDNGDNYYLFHTWRRTKELTKLKQKIICVAWNKYAHANHTREILIGTQEGTVFETWLEPKDEFFRKEEKYLVQVFQAPMPITGIHVERFPTNKKKYLVMISTSTRLYHCVGSTWIEEEEEDKATFERMLAEYQQNPEFQELPSNQEDSKIVFFNRFPELQLTGVPQTFVWLTGAGIFHGYLDFTEKNNRLMDSARLLPFPPTRYDEDNDCLIADTPISILVTEFHFILLYPSFVRALCRLNQKMVYEEPIVLNQGEVVQDMVVDNIKRTYWIYTTHAMYELVIKDEDRDVWKLYLQQKEYATALQYCKEPSQRTQVYTAQAHDDFEQGRYMQSAKYYAKSSVSFEQVTLKFTQKKERDALRFFLLSRLEQLGPNDRTQKTLIATWLVELYLSKMNQLEDMAASVHVNTAHRSFRLKEDQHNLKDEFRTFLETYGTHLHTPTTYQLISSHGYGSEWLYYAYLIGDHEKVIDHWISQDNWDKVMETLHDRNELIYKFSIPLIEHLPERTVNMWISHPKLNPRYLIPAILHYHHTHRNNRVSENQAIRYLSYVVSVFKNTDPIVHDFLLTLYATQPTSDETALLTFLKNEGRDMHYKLDYALRICSQHHRTQSCVHIYSQMGLYEEAVDLALKHRNLDLARTNADKPEDEDGLRKRLWISIAKYVIQDNKDIKSAMQFLKKCDLLKMEDILPFFPDFVLIDDFKDEICSALDEYNIGIEELKAEMDNATSSAEHIRLDVRKLKKRFAIVEEDQTCCLCEYPLLTRQFYVFPCNHQYHADCLGNRITKYLPTRQIRRLADIQEQLSHEYKAARTIQTLEDEKALTERIEHLRIQLDDTIANQCVFCGDVMIQSITTPFYDKMEADSWAI